MEMNEPFFTAALGKEIAKSFIISATTTVGMMVGMIAIGYVVKKVNESRKKSESTVTSA